MYFTREDEELSDFSIAQEGCCMQWGALLCILREKVSQLYSLVRLARYSRALTLTGTVV